MKKHQLPHIHYLHRNLEILKKPSLLINQTMRIPHYESHPRLLHPSSDFPPYRNIRVVKNLFPFGEKEALVPRAAIRCLYRRRGFLPATPPFLRRRKEPHRTSEIIRDNPSCRPTTATGEGDPGFYRDRERGRTVGWRRFQSDAPCRGFYFFV